MPYARVIPLFLIAPLTGCGGSSDTPAPPTRAESAAVDASTSPDAQPSPAPQSVLPEPEASPTPKPEPEPSPPAPGAKPTEVYPTFGMALSPPKGWGADPVAPKVGFIGRWLAESDDPDDWRQFAVEVRQLAGDQRQRQMVAAQLSAPFERGGYTRSDITLDGLPATRYDAPTPDPTAERRPTPSPVIVAKRGDLIYRLLVLMNDPTDSSEFDPVLESWRWFDPQTVVKHLRPGKPTTLFEGLGDVTFPTITRVDTEFTRGESEGYVVFDYHHGQDAIIFVFERDLTPDPPELREHVISYSRVLESRTKLESPLSFGPLPGRQNVYASEIIRGEFPSPAGPVTRTCRYAVWRPRAGAIIRVQAVINDEVFATDAQRSVAASVIDAVLQSCSRVSGVGAD